MPHRTCSVDDCARLHFAKGMCKPHYYRERRRAGLDRSKVLSPEPCKRCGGPFDRYDRKQVYCSDHCHREAKRQRYSGSDGPLWKPRSVPIWIVDCAVCGTTWVSRKVLVLPVCSARRCQSMRYRWGERLLEPVKCRDCDVTWSRLDGRGRKLCGACRDRAASEQGRQYARDWRRRRRELYGKDTFRSKARRLGVAYEQINRGAVYQRDGWRCGLCGKRVAKTRRYPHPQSASLDHIVPMNEQDRGSHTYANVQLAHLSCNVEKGRRGSQQLRMVG